MQDLLIYQKLLKQTVDIKYTDIGHFNMAAKVSIKVLNRVRLNHLMDT